MTSRRDLFVEIVNGRVVRNLFSLLVLQGGNYLLPLILIPFLIRSLEMRTFGDWVFATSFVSFFRTFVSYGFDLTATRTVAIRRDDRAFIGDLYASILVVRLAILVLSCVVLIILALAFANIENVLTLALLSMLVLVGEAFFPIWLFQGMERMPTITHLRLAYRAAFVISTILLVRGPADVYRVPLLEGAGSLASGLIAMHLGHSQYNLAYRWPSAYLVMEQVRDGWSVFVSNAAVNFYTTINTMLLGVVLGPLAVAKYGIAERVYNAIRGMVGTAVPALFPAFSRTYESDFPTFKRSARFISAIYAAVLSLLALPVILLAGWIVFVISGRHNAETALALQIFALSLPFALGSLFSSFLVAQRKNRALLFAVLLTTAANFVIIIPAIRYFGVIGAASAFLLVQLVHAMAQFVANADLFLRRRSLAEKDASQGS